MLLACMLVVAMPLVPNGAFAQNPIGAGRRFALVIANIRYPDAPSPLQTIAKDGRLLAEELRRNDFEVELRENLRKEESQEVLDAFYAKLNAGSAALIYFGGYGMQVGRQSYLLPVNAQVWSETEVRRDGINLDAVLGEMNRRGARVKIAVIDAARTNPFERRFRASSAGLAPVDAPEGSLVLFSAPPGKVVREESGDTSLFMRELGKELRAPNITAEEAFAHTRIGVARASKAEQVPWVASSLIEEFRFTKSSSLTVPSAAGPAPRAVEPGPPVRTPPRPSISAEAEAPAAPTPPSPVAALPVPVPPKVRAGDAKSANRQTLQDCDDCPEMIVVPAKAFEMGSTATPFERPIHQVTFAKPFAIARRETTVEEWNRCVEAGSCKYRPGGAEARSGSHPITNVSWFDAKEYAAWLSAKTRQTYRLPSEAEWEYAAKGGAVTPFAWGQQVGDGKANCRNCLSSVNPELVNVGNFPENGFGLFDMAGNAAEWVEDCWNDSYRGAPQDGSAWQQGSCSLRVLRGGSFDSPATYIRPAARFRYDADVRYHANGFRLVRVMP